MGLFDRRDMGAIAGGQWVDKTIVPELEDVRIRVRGMTCDAVRDHIARANRAAHDADRLPDGSLLPSVAARITREALAEVVLVDAEGHPVSDLRDLLRDPACDVLISAVLSAAAHVDNARAAEALEKN